MTSTAPAYRCTPLAGPAMSDEEARTAAALFKVLADASRVRIVNVLANAPQPVCACDLQGPTGLSQPTISHHMKQLVAAGIVTVERRGRRAYYALDEPACWRLAEICALMPRTAG